MSCLWSYQEIIDELKQKLLYTTLELESVRAQENEGINKNEEITMQLLQLVETVSRERDEARNHLQHLLNKTIPSNSTDRFLIEPTKANSSINESNSFSDTYDYHSHISSPSSSLFDHVSSSPDLSNLNQQFDQDYLDEGSFVIEKVAEGKALPEKGKLLKAVLEAGPLLQTLMVAGPLPRWQNPPPHQPVKIPPFCIDKDADMRIVPKLQDSSFVEMNYGSSQMMPTSSMVYFGSVHYGTRLSSTANLIAAGTNGSSYGFSGKRQPLQ